MSGGPNIRLSTVGTALFRVLGLCIVASLQDTGKPILEARVFFSHATQAVVRYLATSKDIVDAALPLQAPAASVPNM